MRTLLLALALFALPGLSHAQSLTHATRFYPAYSEGRLVGCQVGFSVLRIDTEFSQGEPVLVNGLLVFYGESAQRAGVALRLGVAPASAPSDFRPPERGFLLDGLRTNAADFGESFLSEDPGFRMFPFGLGEATARAIGRSMSENRLSMTYGMPNTMVDAPFEVDFSEHPDVHRQWVECLGAVVSN